MLRVLRRKQTKQVSKQEEGIQGCNTCDTSTLTEKYLKAKI